MTIEHPDIAQRFARQTGIDLESVLAPIDDGPPTGSPLQGNGVYHKIQQARIEDDASTPQGVWEHELRKADWDLVANTALDALCKKSKDLQLAVWLLEAQLHRLGFAAVAPCVLLISELCRRYWDTLYPKMPGGDLEYRTNMISWVNEKLQPVIRLLPITASTGSRQYGWADFEMAQRRDQLRQTNPDAKLDDAPEVQDILQAIAITPDAFLQELFRDLDHGLGAIDELVEVIDGRCGDDAPSLKGIMDLLEEISGMVVAQLQHRGLDAHMLANTSDAAAAETDAIPEDGVECREGNAPAPRVISDRAQAYGNLHDIANYLAQDDPHSPVPYLIMKAVEWGNMNTAELYHQLFVEQQGKLSIFDVLGIGDRGGADQA